MNNKEFGEQLEKRTKDFALRIIRLSSSLPNSIEGKVIKNQITKSGTSIGANYREANKARSSADFMNKIKISEGEANETCYWLEIIHDMNWIENDNINTVLKEAKELLSIFSSISINMKNNRD
ncbi:MAG: four helix bundle protein [Bacteroidetes bacterium]|nr:MAG: four helix bundle protein [Bacteroidota bacterium]